MDIRSSRQGNFDYVLCFGRPETGHNPSYLHQLCKRLPKRPENEKYMIKMPTNSETAANQLKCIPTLPRPPGASDAQWLDQALAIWSAIGTKVALPPCNHMGLQYTAHLDRELHCTIRGKQPASVHQSIPVWPLFITTLSTGQRQSISTISLFLFHPRYTYML